jgi:hypothetical protein
MIVVLDLNGVLMDVRRLEAPKVAGRPPDAVLPNRQKAYSRPWCREFLDQLRDLECTPVLFTSRLRRNAVPVEQAIGDDLIPAVRLYGEDCEGTCPDEPWRPLKSAAAVLHRLDGGGDRQLLFVDDNPDRIDLGLPGGGQAQVLRVATYDAGRDSTFDAQCELFRVLACIKKWVREKSVAEQSNKRPRCHPDFRSPRSTPSGERQSPPRP